MVAEMLMAAHRKKMPRDDVPCRMFTLLVDLLRVPDRMPPLAVAGAWECARLCAYKRDAVGPTALELGFFDLAATLLFCHLCALRSHGRCAQRIDGESLDQLCMSYICWGSLFVLLLHCFYFGGHAFIF